MSWLTRQIRQQFLGFIALFIVLGGVSYAATALPSNSVGSKQIRKSAVNSSKVKDNSLLATDFKAGQLPAGPKGEQGPKGEIGPKGEPGPTASAFAQNSNGIALSGSPTALNQATITTTTQSRIVAQASVDVSAAGAANLYCFITADPGFSFANDWSVRTNDDFSGEHNTGVVGAKVLPAGTYTVFVACGKNTGTLSYVESNLALIATGI